MGSFRAPLCFALPLSLALIAACNALTGASDLELCRGSACADPDSGPPNVVPDAQVVDSGAKDARPPSDASPDAPSPDAGGGCQGAIACERVVFVTSGTFTGNLGGTLGADLECQRLADGKVVHPAVKGRSFRAWVSTAGASAATRMPHGTQPYKTPSGQVIATGWTDLTDGNLVNGIREDEMGVQQNGSTWTGTATDGATALSTCLDWTSSDGVNKGQRGNIGGNGAGWTNAVPADCNQVNRLYCFEY
jgi:hypothetical protein